MLTTEYRAWMQMHMHMQGVCSRLAMCAFSSLRSAATHPPFDSCYCWCSPLHSLCYIFFFSLTPTMIYIMLSKVIKNIYTSKLLRKINLITWFVCNLPTLTWSNFRKIVCSRGVLLLPTAYCLLLASFFACLLPACLESINRGTHNTNQANWHPSLQEQESRV